MESSLGASICRRNGARANLAAHTVLDRPLLRAGETVHMKHFLRDKTVGGFAMVPPAKRPATVTLRAVGGDQHYDFPLKWTAAGTAETTWPIPKAARAGPVLGHDAA